MTARLSLCAAVFGLSSCSTTPVTFDPGLEGLDITAVNPGLVVPGSVIAVQGRSFVGEPWGRSRLRLSGSSGGGSVEVAADARFVDFDRMELDVTGDLIEQLGGNAEFSGTAVIEVDSQVDGETHASPALSISLSVRRQLSPAIDSVASGALIFVNDKIELHGSGLFLTEGEGRTLASIQGCFRPVGQGACESVSGDEVQVVPASEFDRSRGTFAFGPSIAGIRPGTFEGEVRLRNAHATGVQLESDSSAVTYEITEATVFSVTPAAASLGQYVEIAGGGFLGGDSGGLTLLELTGEFLPTGQSSPVPIDPPLLLVPEFLEGRKVRYVLNEDDSLGQTLDLRRVTGSFTGSVNVITSYEADEVRSNTGSFNLGIAPVKQVVFLDFRPSYVESLRHFGLRALDKKIRDRIIEVVERDYATVNLEVRTAKPEDFSLYMEVEISGPDPNGLGLLGYDNTPGKDTGNLRLFDRIGGVNATTQDDGFPGYGGVFIESLFAFSEHPAPFASKIPAADETFDDIFDPFRPDRGGKPVSAADLSGGFSPLTGAAPCPGASRDEEIQCAVWVLGSLIGTTLSHEMGHALGLANPFGEGFHNLSDEPDRLMDSGSERPFAERAELFGHGPARFCQTEYEYLRQILPTAEPTDTTPRPPCF